MSDKKYYSLTTGQKDVLLSMLLLKKRNQDMLCISVYFSIEDPDIDAMEKAYNLLIKENDALRSILVFRLGIKQYIKEYEYQKLEVIDIDINDNLINTISKYRHMPSSMFNNMFTNAYIFKQGNNATILMNFHHMFFDGYSINLVFEKYRKYYEAIVNNDDIDFSEKYSFANFLKEREGYTKTQVYKDDIKYWKDKINEIENLCIPYPVFKPSSPINSKEIVIKDDLYNKVSEYCKNVHVPTYYFIGCITILTVCKMKNKTDTCFFTLTHGRSKYIQKKLIGCVLQLTLSFFHVDDKDNICDYVSSSYLDYLENLKHASLSSFKRVLITLKKCIKMKRFNYYSLLFGQLDIDKSFETGVYKYDLLPYKNQPYQFYCAVADNDNQLISRLNYQTKVIEEERIDEIINNILINIKNIVYGDYSKINDIQNK